MILYSKAFLKCDSADKRVEEVEYHEAPKQFQGSSKIMEADAIPNMGEYAFLHHCFIIGIVVSNNNSTMRAVIKYP